MDKYAKFIETLKKGIAPDQQVLIIPAEVKQITGESCTVLYGELELSEVRLKATINGSSNKLMLLPKIGSMVLVGSLSGDLKDLAVLKIDELEKVEYEQDGLNIEIDSTSNKISVRNNAISLKDLFQELADLLKQFQVFTPVGPSGNPLPTTIQKIVAFENHYQQLLK